MRMGCWQVRQESKTEQRNRGKRMRVIVIGRNYTSRLGMIRAAGQTGAEVIDIITMRGLGSKLKRYLKAPDSSSKFVQSVLYAQEPKKEKLIDVLMNQCRSKTEKAIIIPVDDYAASTIDEYTDLLKDDFLFPTIDGGKKGAVIRCMDKARQKNIARQAEFHTAEGWTIERKNGQYTIPVNMTYPCFPKPELSFLGTKKVMKKCETEAELRKALDTYFESFESPILVEQYINIEKEYGVLGIADHDVVYTPFLLLKTGVGSGSHRGVTMTGKLIRMPEELRQKIEKMISSLSFTGLFDIDLYEADGEIYFNELNMRFGAAGYAVTAAGQNLPEIMIQRLTGQMTHSGLKEQIEQKRNMLDDDQSTKVFVSEKVAFDDYKAGYIDRRQYKEMIKPEKGKISFIRQEEDMKPFYIFSMMSYIQKSLATIKGIGKSNHREKT